MSNVGIETIVMNSETITRKTINGEWNSTEGPGELPAPIPSFMNKPTIEEFSEAVENLELNHPHLSPSEISYITGRIERRNRQIDLSLMNSYLENDDFSWFRFVIKIIKFNNRNESKRGKIFCKSKR